MCVIIGFPRNPDAPPAAPPMCTSLLLRYSSVHKLQLERHLFPCKTDSFQQPPLIGAETPSRHRHSKTFCPFNNCAQAIEHCNSTPKQWLLHIVTCIHPAVHNVHSKRSRAPPRTRVKCVVIALVRHTVVKLPEFLTH